MDLRHFLPLVRHRRYSRRQILSAFHATLAAVAAHRALADAIPRSTSCRPSTALLSSAIKTSPGIARPRGPAHSRPPLPVRHGHFCPYPAACRRCRMARHATLRLLPLHALSDTGPYPPLASGAATWERYEELHPAIVAAEDRLAAEYISPI